ncbi:hypothetical protein GCM10007938_03770 [Vibrio zhanjiangensis]|uniref:Outer membrane protein beta-barrel domain-containing protein n=1 Tax=Vibrio zhanjiangensis TaxID=1046128 RepID=A0ABQ6EV74_9VIBR|nr:hypothetical protein [Vibrio zhanjiangensis]GLT16601.1 hypothetical protein GCM10007938_03770 [Vibrio zhanjiangensis]
MHTEKQGGYSYNLKADGGFDEDEVDVRYGAGAEYFALRLVPITLGVSNVFGMKDDDITNFSLNETIHFL